MYSFGEKASLARCCRAELRKLPQCWLILEKGRKSWGIGSAQTKDSCRLSTHPLTHPFTWAYYCQTLWGAGNTQKCLRFCFFSEGAHGLMRQAHWVKCGKWSLARRGKRPRGLNYGWQQELIWHLLIHFTSLLCVAYDLKLHSKTYWYLTINQKTACAKLLGLFSLHVWQHWKPQPRENSGSAAARFTPAFREAPWTSCLRLHEFHLLHPEVPTP